MKGHVRNAGHGFTLVEVVVVMALLGIIGAIVAVFIRAPIQGYVDSAARAEAGDQADLALRRMARDLRLALPNSIRVNGSGSAVEFLQTKAGGRYLAAGDGAGGQVLDFVSGGLTFGVVGAMPSLNERIADNDYIAVYNLGQDFEPANAYKLGNMARIETGGITRSGGVVVSIKLKNNPFSLQSPPMPSPTQRFQVVSGPVTYYCGPDASLPGTNSLWRMWGYPVTAAQAVPPAGASQALIARRVADCNGLFTYDTSVAAQRSGLVILSLQLQLRNDANARVRLVHQVHVDNTP